MRTCYSLLIVFLCLALSSVSAHAFHNGGTGDCDGCHSQANQGTQSDICLGCHEKQGAGPGGPLVSTAEADMPSGTPPRQRTPGGDFGWLRKNYTWMGEDGRTDADKGERHGHNIISRNHDYQADGTNTAAPGGTYPSSKLQCTSCHDPHGRYKRLSDGTITTRQVEVIGSGSYSNSPDPSDGKAVGVYRLLAGAGYSPPNYPGVVFKYNPPAAVAPPDYNRPESASDVRVAYGTGFSEWCENCHEQFHSDSGQLIHPSGKSALFTKQTAEVYNAYNQSGDLTGDKSRSYTSIVPFELGTSDYQVLKQIAGSGSMEGPSGGANIMCLTCHRAHASGWDGMTRWNVKGTFLTSNGQYPGSDRGAGPALCMGRTYAETKAAYNDIPEERLASSMSIVPKWQRSLCNKCHAED